jgi:hypothetical protein
VHQELANIAYTPKYQRLRKRKDTVFSAKNIKSTETFDLEGGYYAVRDHYEGKVEWGKYSLTASETCVRDKLGAEVHHYRNHDSSNELLSLISHSSGKRYLLFRIDLLGYGVYDIEEKKEFHFVPQEADSLIWVNAACNPLNDVLAVSGCSRGKPSVHILSFANPMQETGWVDASSLMEESCEFLNIPLVHWSEDELILTDLAEAEDGEKSLTVLKEIGIPKDACLAALNII